VADAAEDVCAQDAEQRHAGFRVRSAPQRDAQNGGVFERSSGESGERGGAGVSHFFLLDFVNI